MDKSTCHFIHGTIATHGKNPGKAFIYCVPGKFRSVTFVLGVLNSALQFKLSARVYDSSFNGRLIA